MVLRINKFGLGAVAALMLIGPTEIALAQSDVVCDTAAGTFCRVTDTGLPLRLLTKPGATVYLEMDETSAPINQDIEPFSVLFAFDQVDVSHDANNFEATGWYQVGATSSMPEGYAKANDVVPWRHALALAFTNPGPSERRPVLMFESNETLHGQLDQIQSGTITPTGLYDELDAALAGGQPAPAGIVSREGSGWVDIDETFYLLPILQYENLDSVQLDLLGIQLAALTNQSQAQQTGACDLQQSGGANCLQQQQGGAINSLALDVVFVIDTTTSMQPHIDAVTSAIREVSQTLSQKLPDANALRFGVVGYRDDVEVAPGLEYLTQNFTPELVPAEEFRTLLDSGAVAAASAGSGDWAEDVFAGVQTGIKSNWTGDAARLVILIGDASGHPVGAPKNSTGLSETALKSLADTERVYIASIYVDGGEPTDLRLARRQFETMAAGDAESGSVAFSIVQADGSGVANAEGGASVGLEQSLRDALSKIVDFMGTGQFGAIVDANNAQGDTTGQAVLGAVRAAFVDYIGTGASPPSNITAWVLDRDLTAFEKKAFDVKLMLQRGEVQELTAALETILGKFREGQASSSSFLSQVQIGSTATSYDLKISDAETIQDSEIVPQWIKSLPYKSDVLTLSVDEFRQSSADDRTNFEQRLERLIAFYDEILNQPDAWVRLNSDGSAEDDVYMLGLENLP